MSCEDDYAYKYHRTNTAKIKKEGDITLYHIAIMSMWCTVISPILFLQFLLCDIYMHSRPYTPV